MPHHVKTTYDEARAVANISPRSAAALLRLALQELLVEMGEDAKSIDAAVGNLVRAGRLTVTHQQAMDSLRIIGNNAVHPGEIDLNDTPQFVPALFSLINMIVDFAIAEPKRIAALYEQLPEGARAAVERRDS